jgi:hypothetical protein
MTVVERCGTPPSSASRSGSSVGVGKPGAVATVPRVGYRVKVYVGRRFRYFPRSGIKREFCTLLRVLRVDISGSV